MPDCSLYDMALNGIALITRLAPTNDKGFHDDNDNTTLLRITIIL